MGGETDKVRWRGIQPVYGIRGIWPAVDSVRVNATGAQADTGTTIVYTVGANKRLFISSMFMVSRNVVVQTVGMMAFVRNVGDVEVARLCSNYFVIIGQQTSPMQFIPAVEAEAGYDVCVSSDKDDSAVRLIIGGWLEDV